MKKYLLLWAIVIATGSLFSCEEDDEDVPPPHQVGSWDLKNYAIINTPDGFKFNEGRTFELNEITLGIEAYMLELLQNGEYQREVTFSGSLPVEDQGTYSIEGEELIFNSDDADEDEIYKVENNDNDRLWFSQPIQFYLIEDAILDTLTQEYVDSITDEEYEALFTAVNVDFVYAFEREQ